VEEKALDWLLNRGWQMGAVLGALWSLLILAALCVLAWKLGMSEFLHSSIAAGHMLDWVMGGLCLFWLILLLKAPWDLFFQALAVDFEMQRSRERDINIAPGRENYVRTVRNRLLSAAVGGHVLSALVVAVVTWFSGGVVGYYFAGFYLISTLFRPAIAGYAYLSERLRTIGKEVRYPREDVVELREKLEWMESALRRALPPESTAIELYQSLGDLPSRVEKLDRVVAEEQAVRGAEVRELRQAVHGVGREFEAAISRLTDNQEIISGIQAFVRLVSQTASG